MPTTRRTIPVLLAVGALALGGGGAGVAGEEGVARQVEAFRAAQVAGDPTALEVLCAPELSYSHSDGRVEDRATFVANATDGRSRFTKLDYRDPSIRVAGDAATVRFHWVGEQVSTDGKTTPTNLHILTVWQKRGADWLLLARGATKI